MLVSEFKETQCYRFPQEFLDLLPEFCPNDECNSPTEMSEVLTSLRCTNPRCPSKVAMRLLALLRDLGVKGVGEEKARSFIEKFGIRNPALIFAYEYDEDGGLTETTNEKISRDIQRQITERKNFTLPEYVKICQLPSIQSSANSVFKDYANLADAYRDIEKGGVDFIREKLGIKKGEVEVNAEINERAEKIFNSLVDARGDVYQLAEVLANDSGSLFEGYSEADIYSSLDEFGIEFIKDKLKSLYSSETPNDISIRAITVYKTLLLFKQDLFEAINYVNIIRTDSDSDIKTLSVVCSEHVGEPYATKNDFYFDVNSKFKDKVHVEFLKSVTKDIDYLVWYGADKNDYDEGVIVTRKVTKVRGYNEKFLVKESEGKVKLDENGKPKEHYIPIVTAQQFLDILRDL